MILNGAGCGPAVNGTEVREVRASAQEFKPELIDKDVTRGIWTSPQILGYPGLLLSEQFLLGLIDGLTNKETPCKASTAFLADRIQLSLERTESLLRSLTKRGFCIQLRRAKNIKRVVAKELSGKPRIVEKWITICASKAVTRNGFKAVTGNGLSGRHYIEEIEEEKKERTESANADQEVGSFSSFCARSSQRPIASATATTPEPAFYRQLKTEYAAEAKNSLTRNQSEERHCSPEPDRTREAAARNPGTHIPGPPHCEAISDSHCGAAERNGSDQDLDGELGRTVRSGSRPELDPRVSEPAVRPPRYRMPRRNRFEGAFPTRLSIAVSAESAAGSGQSGSQPRKK